MVKAYLRYDLASTFGVVASNSNVVYDHTGKLIITASLENICVWNVKQGTLVCTMCCSAEIFICSLAPCMCPSHRLHIEHVLFATADQDFDHSFKLWQGTRRSHPDSSWPQ